MIRGFASAVHVKAELYKWSSAISNVDVSESTNVSLLVIDKGEAASMRSVPRDLHLPGHAQLLAHVAAIEQAARFGYSVAVTIARPLEGFVERSMASANFVTIVGWARDSTLRAPALGVVACADGIPITWTHPWLSRADVARHFGDADNYYGFALEIPRTALEKAALHTLQVLAVGESGERTVLPLIEPVMCVAWSPP
jgi:hypothetical protein